jgi:Flp pilus assembly protein TadG
MGYRQHTRQSGAALVEFALVATILVVLMAGMYEFGRAFWFYDALSKATRDGARAMSVAKVATISSIGVPAAKTVVANAAVAAGMSTFDASYVTITCLDTDYNAATCSDGMANLGGVKVEITGYRINIGQTIPLIGNPVQGIDLTPSTTMRHML